MVLTVAATYVCTLTAPGCTGCLRGSRVCREPWRWPSPRAGCWWRSTRRPRLRRWRPPPFPPPPRPARLRPPTRTCDMRPRPSVYDWRLTAGEWRERGHNARPRRRWPARLRNGVDCVPSVARVRFPTESFIFERRECSIDFCRRSDVAYNYFKSVRSDKKIILQLNHLKCKILFLHNKTWNFL